MELKWINKNTVEGNMIIIRFYIYIVIKIFFGASGYTIRSFNKPMQ